VNPNGAATAYSFDYGTTTSFGTVVGPFDAGSGTALEGQPGQVITGLAANTTYLYRVAARHGTDPEVFGEVRAFTTGGSPTPPAAVTGVAAQTSPTGGTAVGVVNAHGQPTAYTIEYGTSTSFGNIAAVQSAGSSTGDLFVSVPFGGLSPGTTYYYRLVATNATGTTLGQVSTFTTSPTAPTAITGAASAVTPTGAVLSGTLNPRNGATAFTFEYGTTTSFGQITAVDSVPATPALSRTVSLPVSGLSPDTMYFFRLVATNANGTTAGAVMSFTTPQGT
jgi:phosphodiesterase/alkaline phosphatase D-like protein